MYRQKPLRPKVLRLNRRRRGAEFATDWQNALPIIGSVLRSKKLIKTVLRSDRLLKSRRVPQLKRLVANSTIGANSLLTSGKLKPAGAVLYGIDRTGKAMVHGWRRGGVVGAYKGMGVGVRNAAGNIKRSGEKLIAPATLTAGKARRAYGLLPDSLSRRQRVTASLKVGVSQLLKKNRRKGVGKKLYATDRGGRNVVRKVRRWRRRRSTRS